MKGMRGRRVPVEEGGRDIYLVVLLYNERPFLREHLWQREEEKQLLPSQPVRLNLKPGTGSTHTFPPLVLFFLPP